MSKITKTLTAALIVATATVSLAVNSYAAPRHQQGPTQGEQTWMDHASQNVDGGGD